MEGTANWRIGDIVVFNHYGVGKIVNITCEVIPQTDIDNAIAQFIYTIQLPKKGNRSDYTGSKIKVEEKRITRLYAL